jgi:hypothetical protein
MERYLVNAESPNDVNQQPPNASSSTSLSGQDCRTTLNPHYVKACRRLVDSGAEDTFRAKHQRVEPQVSTPTRDHTDFDAGLDDAARASEYDAYCLDDAVLASMPLP